MAIDGTKKKSRQGNAAMRKFWPEKGGEGRSQRRIKKGPPVLGNIILGEWTRKLRGGKIPDYKIGANGRGNLQGGGRSKEKDESAWMEREVRGEAARTKRREKGAGLRQRGGIESPSSLNFQSLTGGKRRDL